AYQSRCVSCLSLYPDVFVTKLHLNSDGTADVLYSTFLGGSGWEYGYGIAVDSAQNAYVAGYTVSSDFPTTSGSFQEDCPSCYYITATNQYYGDGFVTKVISDGTGLAYSTFLGGALAGPTYFANDDAAYGIAVDAAGF